MGSVVGWARRGAALLTGSQCAVRQVAAAAVVVATLATATACSGESPPPPGSSAPATTSLASAAGHDSSWVATENARAGTSDWQLGQVAGDTELAGYCGQVSVLPGEDASLFVTSTVGDFTVTAYRMGWYGGKGAREVWRTPKPVRGVAQAPASVAADGTVTTSWNVSATLPTTGWPEGSYLLALRGVNGGPGRYVPLVVRSRSVKDRLVLNSAVLTYQAYNAWGGHSLYKGPDGGFGSRSRRVSFDRPYDRNGAMEVFKFEIPVVQRAERLGVDLAYVTGWDVDQRAGLLDGARGLVTMGHDEYWTVPERDAVERARDQGMNVAFLGANVAYWRVRLEQGRTGQGRTMVGYKSLDDPVKGATTTVLWRSDPGSRPENSLTGMLYECYPARGAMVVHDSAFFLFAGTGASAGTSYPGLVGTEVDRAYPIAGTPKNLQVVAHSPVTCSDRGGTVSDVTYYTTDSGAGVFAVGTMMWVTAVGGRTAGTDMDGSSVGFAMTVTDNLFRAMVAGPMGKSHPARANLEALHASSSTERGTGGPVGGQATIKDTD
ncbi:hypothetical protein KEM60_01833 [Austwickia sp. TVS 96-490-7B]|uniref:N,N-dimethylformamidase beta subunit family domain-containing protein n=1 Tax=Austwickia sp. TVS 96-490-7B TaxID=2830843 RepID=UPI001C570C34|nr:N,N-dimethylformamidase beta subunit family domain-containing protein [Austwickia sp. TVS 96-490-7B]MBW3085630.1 hypothetical protein [Austwickia sp. TVS 96-490-7B]